MTRADRASLTVGCLLYVGSAPLLPLVLAISTSSRDYEEGTREWWVAVLGMMFRLDDEGPVAVTLLIGLLVGVSLIGRGLWRAFGGLRFTIGRMMVAVLVVALGLASAPLGFLMAVMAMLAPVVLTLVALLRKPALASGHGRLDVHS